MGKSKLSGKSYRDERGDYGRTGAERRCGSRGGEEARALLVV